MKYTELLRERPAVTFEFTPNDFGKETYADIDYAIKKGVSGISITTHDTKGRVLPFHTNFDIAYQLSEMYKEPFWDPHFDIFKKIAIIPHISCASSYSDIDYQLDKFHEAGVENILAIRGDGETPGNGQKKLPFRPHPKGPKYAYDLIERIHDRYDDFCIGAACYPEGHEDTQNSCMSSRLPYQNILEMEIEHLYAKSNAGANFFFGQICFDNDTISNFKEMKDKAGIKEPVIGGVKAIVKYGQARSVSDTFCVKIPQELDGDLEKHKEDRDFIRQTGIDYAVNQNKDLLSSGISVQNYATKTTPVRELVDGIFSK